MKYGRLTVLKETRRASVLWWTCRCDCGQKKQIVKQSIVQGLTKSCGCLGDESRRSVPRTHGQSRTTTYQIWLGMVARCRNENEPAYPQYGGRGIKVCARWLRFENFLADMGKRPAGKSIDRIDNDGSYEPRNCRWATRAEQARNRSTNILIEFRGEKLCLADWAARYGLKPSTLYAARRRGRDVTTYFQEAR